MKTHELLTQCIFPRLDSTGKFTYNNDTYQFCNKIYSYQYDFINSNEMVYNSYSINNTILMLKNGSNFFNFNLIQSDVECFPILSELKELNRNYKIDQFLK